MSPKSSIAALIVAVVLLMSGGIIGAFIFSSPTVVGSGEDHVSTNVSSGDHYEVTVSSDATSITASYSSRSEFFDWLYTFGGMRDPLHYKNITVNDTTVKCDWYSEETETGKKFYFVDPGMQADHARVYGYEEYVGDVLIDSRYLQKTNFTLDKTIAEQTMYEGESMSYLTDETVSNKICPAVTLTLESTVTQTVGRYVESQIKWAVSVETASHDTDTEKATVVEYAPTDSGGKVILDNGKIITKREFLMTLDYIELLTYIKETGATMSRGVPVAKTIDTVYGQRDVTEETLTVFGSFNSTYVIDFGSDYVIYSITEMKNGQEGSTVTKVVSSNLIHEGTKVVYGSPPSITVNNVTLAAAIIIFSAAGAIIIGYFAFKIIRNRSEME